MLALGGPRTRGSAGLQPSLGQAGGRTKLQLSALDLAKAMALTNNNQLENEKGRKPWGSSTAGTTTMEYDLEKALVVRTWISGKS